MKSNATRISLAVMTLSVLGLISNPAVAQDFKTIKGYKVYGCTSEFRDYKKDLCSNEVMTKVLNSAKKTKINFNKDKKLIEFTHKVKGQTLYEPFVVDDKNKSIYIRLAPAYGKLHTTKDSNVICVHGDGEYFGLDYKPTAENPLYPPVETDNSNNERGCIFMGMGGFKKIPHALPNTMEAYEEYGIF